MQSGIEREAQVGALFPVNLTEGNEMAAANEAERIFERLRTQLKARLGVEVYSSWFGRMKLAEASKGVVRLSVPTAFLKSWINGHYLDVIAELWRQEEPELFRIEIIVRSATRPPTMRLPSAILHISPSLFVLAPRCWPRATWDT